MQTPIVSSSLGGRLRWRCDQNDHGECATAGNQTILLPKVLVTLAGFGAFALFSERPMNNGGFWIMLPVGVRLAETSRADADAPPDAVFVYPRVCARNSAT